MIPNNSDYNPSNSEKLNNTFSSQDYDVDKLLNFAEDLKKNCDFYLDKIESLILIQKIILIFGINTLIILLIVYLKYENNFNNSFLIILYLPIVLVYILMLVETQIKKNKRRFYSEQKALEETVELLREISGLIYLKNQWKELQDIEFRIRLSRFNIGKYLVPQSLFEGLTKKKNSITN